MGAYGLPRGACQPRLPIGGCSATDLGHTLLWTGFAVPIPSKGSALDVPYLDVCIRYWRAGISAAAGIFELTALRRSWRRWLVSQGRRNFRRAIAGGRPLNMSVF